MGGNRDISTHFPTLLKDSVISPFVYLPPRLLGEEEERLLLPLLPEDLLLPLLPLLKLLDDEPLLLPLLYLGEELPPLRLGL